MCTLRKDIKNFFIYYNYYCKRSLLKVLEICEKNMESASVNDKVDDGNFLHILKDTFISMYLS